MRPQAAFLLFMFSFLEAFAAPVSDPGLRVLTREVEPSHRSLVRRHPTPPHNTGVPPQWEPGPFIPEDELVMELLFAIDVGRVHRIGIHLRIKYQHCKDRDSGALIYKAEVIKDAHENPKNDALFHDRYVYALTAQQDSTFEMHNHPPVVGEGVYALKSMHYKLTTMKCTPELSGRPRGGAHLPPHSLAIGFDVRVDPYRASAGTEKRVLQLQDLNNVRCGKPVYKVVAIKPEEIYRNHYVYALTRAQFELFERHGPHPWVMGGGYSPEDDMCYILTWDNPMYGPCGATFPE